MSRNGPIEGYNPKPNGDRPFPPPAPPKKDVTIDKVGDVAHMGIPVENVESVQVHNFKEGDVLFVKVVDGIVSSQNDYEEMRAAIKQVLPEGIKFLICQGMEFEVLRKEFISKEENVLMNIMEEHF